MLLGLERRSVIVKSRRERPASQVVKMLRHKGYIGQTGFRDEKKTPS